MAKSWNFRGVGGVRPDPLEGKIQGGGGSNWKNPPWGGYGYFLEPHNITFEGKSKKYRCVSSCLISASS